MTHRGMVRLLAALVIGLLPAMAADLEGKWSGTATSQHGSEPVLMTLKVSGMEVTGSVGPDEDRQFPIENGHFEGNKFTFQLTAPNHGVFRFELTLDGNSLKGPGTRTLDGETEDGAMELKRAS